ncbi:hypothetical protein RB195_023657 [Necator americanus]|uniref:Mos1 transposase HTH domain-containing protein n=1 Tax=Necator americanus TaxID=51031 RepID=A0ABR1EK30_NECAM
MAEHFIHIRHVLLYEFESGHLATEAHRNLSQVFGAEALSGRSVRVWYQRFKSGNKKLEDEPRSSRPTAKSFDELKNLVEQHPYERVRYFAASLGHSLSTVSNGLRSLGIVKKLRQWLPHALSHDNCQRRLDICTQLLSRNRRFDWLDTIVTEDKKWVLYVNHTHKRAWCAGDEIPDPFVKGEIHEKKIILSVWYMESTVSNCCRTTRQLLSRSTALNCKDWPTKSARSTRSSKTFACCTIMRALTSRKRLPRKFWSSDGKFYRTHRTARTWARPTTISSDRFCITWKRSATMIVTTSKMTFGLSSPPSRRSSMPKESVIL